MTLQKQITHNASSSKIETIDHDAEVYVIGAIVQDFKAIRSAIQYIKPEMFSDVRHKAMMIAIYDLYEQKKPIDLLTLTQQLRKHGTLELVGGASYVTSITNRIASAANIEAHIFIVIENWLRQQVQVIAHNTHNEALSKTGNIIEIIETAVQDLKLLYNTVVRPTRSLDSVADEIEQQTVDNYSPTPWRALNDIIGGNIYGELMYIGGRPGMGKSAMLANMAQYTSQTRKKPTAVFTVEMKTKVLLQRMISSVVEINSNHIIYNSITSEQRKQVAQAIRNMEKTLHITDNLVMVEDIVGAMYNYTYNFGVREFYFDYIQRIGTREKFNNRDLALGHISALIANTLKELNAVGVAGAQLKRAEGTKATSLPTMDDLRESGNFEQDASIILFPFRPIYAGLKEDNYNRKYTDIDVILRIAKSRNGKTGRVNMFYKDIYTLFYEENQLALDNNMLLGDEPEF